MKVFRDLILAIFVSPEFLIIAACVALFQITPKLFFAVGTILAERDEALKWISLAPTAVLAVALKWAKDALLPKTHDAELLAGWSGFYILKNRVLAGVFYVFTAACVSVGVWASGADLKRPAIGAVYVASIGINVIAAATLWYASLQVGIHLRRTKNEQIG